MAKAIGIDLGTTNSAAGLKKLRAEIIVNAEGDLLTPSVVAHQVGQGPGDNEIFVVGKQARQWLAQDPENTIVSVKRLMGRNINDPDVQRLIQEKRFAYTIKSLATGSEHSVAVLLHGQEYTPEEISSKIIAKIRADCEQQLGDQVEYAVVTVPAYFNDKQTHGTRVAAAMAGLKVQRLLPEPTAAAISFGVDNLTPGTAQTVLVFDFGGGTFDISILTIRDGQFIEQGKGGDMWMGGDDIDALIGQYVYRQTASEQGLDSLEPLIERLPTDKKNRFLSELKQKVESAKIQLSEREKTFIEILGLLQDADGDILDIEVELTREQFEKLLLPIAERAITLVKRVIATTNFDLELIDKVVMVGGSSTIPLIIRKIKELFGEDKVLLHPRPMLAITEGAAIMAHRLADHYECPSCGQQVQRDTKTCAACQFDLATDLAKTGVVGIVHTTSHDYFLKLEDGSDYLLVLQNTPLPLHLQTTFRMLDPDQNLAHFQFFNRTEDQKESIGDLWLSFDITSETAAEENQTNAPPEVILDFDIDEDNIITVAASLKNRAEIKIGRTLSRGKRDEKLLLDLEQTIEHINQGGQEYYVAYEFLQRSIPLAATINHIIHPETGEEDQEMSQRAERMLDAAKQLLALRATPSANCFYAENLLEHYSFAMTADAQERLQQRINLFRLANAQTDVAQILAARDELVQETNHNHAATLLKDVDDALEILTVENPAQAPRLEQASYDLTQAVIRGDRESFMHIAAEIKPEVERVFIAEQKKTFHIWKDIRK